jgi:hypothetical protein
LKIGDVPGCPNEALEIYASFGDGTGAKAASPKQEIVRQIFLRLAQSRTRGGQRRTVRESVADQAVERLGTIQRPPLRREVAGGHEALCASCSATARHRFRR